MQQVATLETLDKPITIELGDTKILLIRDGDMVRAFGAECPHAGAPLGEGAVCDGRIICPWHKASFSLRDGALLEPPALEGLTRYPVTVEGGAVLVSSDPMPRTPCPNTTDARTMLIVGAGAAGTAAACALREFGFAGRIVLLGHEPGAPYDRTALSKFVLQGAMQPDTAPTLREDSFYADQQIERLHDEAVALDPAARTVAPAGGGSIGYDSVLIATGGLPRAPDVPGGELPHVHVLRTREDAAAILAGLRDKSTPVVIVGSGFIGLEAASALREQDIPVTVVCPRDIPFEAQFGTELGTMFRRLHEQHGVRWLGGRKVARIDDDFVTLDDGQRLPAGLVLAGLGITPATGFASGLARTPDGGIIVDGAMRAADGVFAAGDVARFPLGGHDNQKVEHWRVAQQHGRAAAAGMLGRAAPPPQTPFFWTYHYGKRYEYIGHPQEFDQVEIDGDFEAGDFLARLRQGGALVGLVACGREAQTAAMIARPPFAPE